MTLASVIPAGKLSFTGVPPLELARLTVTAEFVFKMLPGRDLAAWPDAGVEMVTEFEGAVPCEEGDTLTGRVMAEGTPTAMDGVVTVETTEPGLPTIWATGEVGTSPLVTWFRLMI